LILAFFGDTFWRVRGMVGEERALIIFASSLAFVFFVNALSGPILSDPELMLALWILMLLPASVRRRVRPQTEARPHPSLPVGVRLTEVEVSQMTRSLPPSTAT
jgi:hypothetical protein